MWHGDLPDDVQDRTLAAYDAFYERMRDLLRAVERAHGRFVVFDVHAYNHRRGGPEAAAADPDGSPQVDLDTASIDRPRWGTLVDRFIRDLRDHDFPGGRLDVRENVRFSRGHFCQWVHETFPGTGCALGVELKKFFMDEWTGRPDRAMIDAVGEALRATVEGVLQALERLP